MNKTYRDIYNPDVLTCLANLSNDEVFTSPKIANQILDMLPEEIWHDSTVTFLDPVCKSGVFLREIAKRLIEGLKEKIPNLQDRIDHIFHKQLYGIAITELTSLISRRSLYCSKYANSKYSISYFDNVEGNIRYKHINHKWKDNKCIFCGAPKSIYNRGKELETYAYEWIHTNEVEKIFNMKFDVIIGNPPYHLSDGGNGKSATPIYQLFIEQAKKLNPRYLTMIVPSRWFVGGKNLSKFRQEMLADKRIKKLVDYENFRDVFPGVDLAGGVCYFLWDRDYQGICEVTNFNKDKSSTVKRFLDEYDIFIRQNYAINIVKKITKKYSRFLNERVSTRKPFGLPTNYTPTNSGIPCWFKQKTGLKYALFKDVNDSKGYLNKWKLLVPKAPIAGQTDFTKPVHIYYEGNIRIAKPGECCTESWIIAGAFDSEEEVISYKSYIFTKMVRFLLLQAVVSQDITRKNYCFIPDLQYYKGTYTDQLLCKMWGISDEEWKYIDSRITNLGENKNGK